ncbi:MAG: tRNA 2-thiocytidine(32) synthetase TtcA [Myxococcota bacterium]
MKVTRLENKLMGQLARASKDFQLIEPGDRIMVCMSGGKDSYAMLHLLRLIQRRVPFEFSMIAVNLDQGHPGFPGHLLESYFKDHGDAYRMLKQDTYSIVLEKIPVGKTFCSLCSRLRRGILYNAAVELGCSKIALGHHRDDIIETLMLNLLYSGQLKAMPPRLRSDDGRNVVIRPLAYCNEEDLAALAQEQAFPIIPCDLCGSQENLQRQQVKRLINELHAANPKVKGNMFSAVQNVRPSHLLDAALREAMGLDAITGQDDALLGLG